jgi:type IV pilus assembly protein PilO
MAKQLPSLPFEKIAALTRLQRMAICIGTFVVLGALFYYLIYMPKSAEIAELEKTYEDLDTKLTRAKAAAKDHDKYQKMFTEAQGKFRLVLRTLPDKKEIPSLLEGISRSGRHAGLEFLLFEPGKEVAKGFYAEIPVKIEVSGGYHNLAMFFDKVARLPRIVNISNISVTKEAAGKTAEAGLKATCVATTYRFLEVSEKQSEKPK